MIYLWKSASKRNSWPDRNDTGRGVERIFPASAAWISCAGGR